jgi:hypothetical protein
MDGLAAILWDLAVCLFACLRWLAVFLWARVLLWAMGFLAAMGFLSMSPLSAFANWVRPVMGALFGAGPAAIARLEARTAVESVKPRARMCVLIDGSFLCLQTVP